MGEHIYFQLISSKMMKLDWKYNFFFKYLGGRSLVACPNFDQYLYFLPFGQTNSVQTKLRPLKTFFLNVYVPEMFMSQRCPCPWDVHILKMPIFLAAMRFKNRISILASHSRRIYTYTRFFLGGVTKIKFREKNYFMQKGCRT